MKLICSSCIKGSKIDKNYEITFSKYQSHINEHRGYSVNNELFRPYKKKGLYNEMEYKKNFNDNYMPNNIQNNQIYISQINKSIQGHPKLKNDQFNKTNNEGYFNSHKNNRILAQTVNQNFFDNKKQLFLNMVAELINYVYLFEEKKKTENPFCLLSISWFYNWKKVIKYDSIPNKRVKNKILEYFKKENIDCIPYISPISNNDIYKYYYSEKFLDQKTFIIIDKFLWIKFTDLYSYNQNETIYYDELIPET